MQLNTNLSVPIFNVLKYLVLTLAIDVLVRGGLDSFEHFRRRLLLDRGQSVQFEPVRIDRYNLFHRVPVRHLRFSLILIAITLAAYSVEIGLEFATDSTSTLFAVAGNATRLNYTDGVCSLDSIIYRVNADRLASLAEKCVVHERTHEGDVYRLYRPIWIRTEEESVQPLCEPTRQNLLYEGNGTYHSLRGLEEQSQNEIQQLIHTMRAHSYKSHGDVERSFVTINVTSSDIIGKFPYEFLSDNFTTAVFLQRLGDSDVKCFGSVYGRHGEGMMRVMMIACSNGFTENSTLAYAQGTGLVEMDVQDLDDKWSTLVAVENRRTIFQFAKGVVGEGLEGTALAYAVFLALSRAQELINVNKYAISYRHCHLLSLPSRDGGSWNEIVSARESVSRNTATVEMWAIILVACWVSAVSVARFLIHNIANSKGMPNGLIGEQGIVCLWMQQNERRKELEFGDHIIQKCEKGFLSVESGSLMDSITATNQPRDIQRDRSKPFVA